MDKRVSRASVVLRSVRRRDCDLTGLNAMTADRDYAPHDIAAADLSNQIAVHHFVPPPPHPSPPLLHHCAPPTLHPLSHHCVSLPTPRPIRAACIVSKVISRNLKLGGGCKHFDFDKCLGGCKIYIEKP